MYIESTHLLVYPKQVHSSDLSHLESHACGLILDLARSGITWDAFLLLN